MRVGDQPLQEENVSQLALALHVALQLAPNGCGVRVLLLFPNQPNHLADTLQLIVDGAHLAVPLEDADVRMGSYFGIEDIFVAVGAQEDSAYGLDTNTLRQILVFVD